jgi:hypothetical protein
MSPEPRKPEMLLTEPVPPADGHLTELALEQLALPAAPLDSHVQGCPACQQRLSAIRSERASFIQDHPAERVIAPALEIARVRPRRWLRWTLAGAAPVAVGLLLVFLLPLLRDHEGIKGGPAVRLFVKRAEAVWQAAPGERFLPGDALRVQVTSGKAGYVRLFAQDGWRVLPLAPDAEHEPGQLAQGIPVGAGEPLDLPGSLVLNESPGSDALLVLVSEEPLAPESSATLVQQALASLATKDFLPLKLQDGVWAIRVKIWREVPRP